LVLVRWAGCAHAPPIIALFLPGSQSPEMKERASMSELKTRHSPWAVVERLVEISHLHRSCAWVMAGHNPKVPELWVKVELARHAYDDLAQAMKLEQHIGGLTRQEDGPPTLASGFRALISRLDSAPDAAALAAGVYLVLKPKLLQLYREAIPSLHETCDATARHLLVNQVESLEAQCSWGKDLLSGAYRNDATDDRVQNLLELWRQRHWGAPLTAAEATLTPRDRVPRAARAGIYCPGIPGAARIVPIDRWMDRNGIGLAMHNQLHGEYTTMELASRNFYEHPDMPAAFGLDMARQAADEARHALIFEELAAEHDVRYEDYPIYTLTYDGYYEFGGGVPAGSREELLWRLLVRGTIDEGLALDDLRFQIQGREYFNQTHISDRLRYVLSDEMFHVQAALKWTRYLCGNDESRARSERDRVRRFVENMLNVRRLQFERSYPEKVKAEREYASLAAAAVRRLPPLPSSRRLNVQHRKLVGYSEEDLRQVVDWKYVEP
jgi:uncharacterized ferritin-like protein (DUF455 family)